MKLKMLGAAFCLVALAGCGGVAGDAQPVSQVTSVTASDPTGVCPDDGVCAPYVPPAGALCPAEGVCAPHVPASAVCPDDGLCAPHVPAPSSRG